MCTVSFIPLKNSYILTSNRDEKNYRPTIPPSVVVEENKKMVYPKDKFAGGSWILIREDATAVILLNGAFINHQKKTEYRKSRGLILLEISKAKFPLYYFLEMDLTNIEPFTLIIFQKKVLTEVKWDGLEKHIFDKSIKVPHIWSSATLYSRKQKNTRKQWFEEFCRYNQPLTEKKVFDFHATFKKENPNFGLVIQRQDQTQTVSITQLQIKKEEVKMIYLDKIKNEISELVLLC